MQLNRHSAKCKSAAVNVLEVGEVLTIEYSADLGAARVRVDGIPSAGTQPEHVLQDTESTSARRSSEGAR